MTSHPSENPDTFEHGYEVAYEEIRTAMRDPNHPSVFVCTCPPCEILAEILQGVADTMNYFLTEDEAELFTRLLQAVEERHNVENWPSLVVKNTPEVILEQKSLPE